MPGITTRSANETKKIASFLAKEASKSKTRAHAFVIALSGALGAGKTTFVQGFASGLGIKERILSPTFVLMKIYNLKPTTHKPRVYKHLVHIDCYRVHSSRELAHLGVKEIFKDTKGIVLIEWPERIQSMIPKNALWIRLKHGKKENERIISFLQK